MALSKLTVLNEKYVLRKVLGSHGPYDISYLAWNLSKERNAVVIREYNPSFIVKRIEEGAHFEYKDDEAKKYFDYGLNCFVREAAAAALIDHPNVVKHEDYFRENDTSYCVSTYYPGATLAKVLEGNQSRIEKRAAYAIIMPLLDGLLAGHRQGLIHGRLSPDQIFLTKSGRPMLFRFHVTRILLARRCARVLDLNEPGYTAPELLIPNGKKGPWSDVYSCGATLYSIVTGNIPVDALQRSEKDPFLDILNDEQGLSSGLKKLLYRSMSVDPEERPQSILEFKQELMNVMDLTEREFKRSARDPIEKQSSFSLKNAPALGKLSIENDAVSPGASLFDTPRSYADPEREPFSPPRKKSFSGGGDGFNSPDSIPFIDTEASARAFVETNPLGPFAHEKMPVSSEKVDDVTTSQQAFARLEAQRERIQLKKAASKNMLPILASVGAIMLISVLWLSGVFVRGDAETAVEPLPTNPDLELLSSASATQQEPPAFGNLEENQSASIVLPDSSLAPSSVNEPVNRSPVSAAADAGIDSFALGRANIQSGDSLRLLRRFQQAALYYQNALVYMPGDSYADSMLSVVEDQYRDQSTVNQVRRYARTAQELMEEEKYEEAKDVFEQALRIRPGDTWIQAQIAAVDEAIENASQDERRFQYLLAQGDGFFDSGNYEIALERYEEAIELHGEDEYILERIQRAKDSMQVEVAREETRDNLYNTHIALADSFLSGFDFDNALSNYQAALQQRPQDTYAMDQVMSVQKKRLEQIDRLTDDGGVFEVTDVAPKMLNEATLVKQIRYPISAERANVEGRVILKMIVNENGEPSDIEVLRGIGMGCDREAVRVLEKARFEPAKHQGQTVRSWFTYTVMFKLAN